MAGNVPAALEARMKAYESLSPFERSVLDIMALSYISLGAKNVVSILQGLGVRGPEGRAPNSGAVTEVVKRLKQSRLAQETARGNFCHRDLVELITRRMVAEGRFPAIARLVSAELSVDHRWGRAFRYTSHEHAVAIIRLALYARDFGGVEDAVSFAYEDDVLDFGSYHPLSTIISNPFDPAWLSTFPNDEQVAWISLLLIDMLKAGDAPDEVIAYAQGILPGAGAELRLNLEFILAEIAFYQGRFDDALSANRAVLGSLVDLLQARYFVVTGAPKEALPLYEGFLEGYKKETKKRKPKFPTVDWVFFILGLMDAGSEYLPRALELAEWGANDRSYYYRDLCAELVRIIRSESGSVAGEPPRGDLWGVENWDSEPGMVMKLLSLLTEVWQGHDSLKRDVAELTEVWEKARSGGYRWLEHEFASLLESGGGKGRSIPAARAAELRATLGVRPLSHIVHRLEDWERVLKALVQVTRTDEAPASGEKESRLVWMLHFHYGSYLIEAKEQKRSANGRWTKGRMISLQRLRDDGREMGFLTPQDLQVCEYIKAEPEVGYWRRPYTTYNMPLEALIALVGHPHVYLGETGAQVEVAVATPELRVTRSKQGFALEVLPGIPTSGRVRVEREGDTRILVYEYTKEILRVAAILGKGVAVPQRGEAEVMEAVARLSSLVTVHSDVSVADSTIPKVEADPTPIVQLLPSGEGLLVHLRVQPLPDGGPLFPPGSGGEVVMAEVNGARLQTLRRLGDERERADRIVDACPTLAIADAGDAEWRLDTPEDALEFLTEVQACGSEVRIQWPKGQKYAIRATAGATQFRMNIKGGHNWFEVSGDVQVDDELVLDMQRLLELTAGTKSRFVDLGGGQFVALTQAFRRKLDELRSVGEERDGVLRLHALASPLMEDLVTDAGSVKANRIWKEQMNRLREARTIDPEVPSTLRATLRDYQIDGFKWLARLAAWGVGACLADDMGLGKTVQILAIMLRRASGGPQLVIAPTSVCANWEDEAIRFTPTLRVHRFGTGNREETVADLGPYDVLVCSYGLLQSEHALFKSITWHTIVLDEAQAIKNMATKRSKAVMDLEGDFRIIATGTPIENHLGELWNLYRFINPGFLGSLEHFNTRFAVPIEKHEHREAGRHLKQLIQPFILRRRKEEVLDELPARTDIVLHVELGDKERAFYEALRRKALQQLSDVKAEPGRHHVRILAEIMRLRRACCNSRLVDAESTLPSAKLEVFEAVLDDLMENRHKALVFSQFVDHLSILRSVLDRKKITYQYLDGSTPTPARKKAVDAFQGGQGDVFLVSLKAGGLGLNLTAADYVIHMDPWWNPAVEDQASDRAHRIGQQRPVTVYRLVAKDTIEDQITALHHRKRDLANSLLEGADMAGKVTAEELLALLQNG